MIKFYWYLFRVSSFLSRPLSNLTEFFRARWEERVNQHWIDNPVKYEAMRKLVNEIVEEILLEETLLTK